MATTMAGMPNATDAQRQPTAADREPAPIRRELLGQQAVADRMLRRPADP